MDPIKKVTWKKKIKVPNKNHITNDIDNTAPISQIIDELSYKNKEAFKFYGRNLRQRWSLIKHSLLPNYPLNNFNEDWDGQLLSNYFEPLRYKSLPPQIITSIRHQGKKDPIIEYMRKKLEWNEKLRNYAYTANTHKYEQRLETLNDNVISCPKAIVSMAHLLDNDPEPYFNSTYNWYYAGFGSLHLITLSDKQYLLYSEFTTLYLKEFNKTEVKIIPHDPVASYDCGEEYNIFEIVYSIETIPVVALRAWKKIFILKINISNDQIEFEKITSLDAEKPFVGISFDTFHKKVLYVTLIDWNLYLINVETFLAKKILLKGNSSKLLNNWNIILGTKRGYYTNVAGNTINVYDKRTNVLEHVFNNIKSIVDETCCNPITVARQFEGSDYLYFGTNHHLFVLDLRFVKQFQLQATQRWTHGMEFPPVYLNKCNFESNRNLLCLSSQWCEDMCVISDYKKGAFVTSDSNVTIPYRPPSILSVLQEAQSQLSCDEIYNLFDSRLSTTISGTTLIEQTNSFDILMLNSLGDITHHALYPEHMNNIVDDSVQQLQEWAKSYKTDKKMFEITATIDIAKVWKKLVKVPEDKKLVTDIKDERFDINEIKETFEKEEIDVELKEVWMEGMDQTGDELTIKN